jgi:hypothetical protein
MLKVDPDVCSTKMRDMMSGSKTLTSENPSHTDPRLKPGVIETKFMKSLTFALLLALSATAQPYDLTLYSAGFGVVKESRTYDLKAGSNLIGIGGLPATVDAMSLFPVFDGRLNAMGVSTERANPMGLLMSQVGTSITLIGPTQTFTGVVERVSNGVLFLKQADGSIAAISNPTAFVPVIAGIPSVFTATPTVDVDLIPRRAGRQNVDLYYKAGGLRWSAQYRVEWSENGQNAKIGGYAMVDNQSGMDFRSTTLRFLAGDIRVNDGRPAPVMYREDARLMAMSADVKSEAESVGDVYVYTLDKPVDVPSGRQTRYALIDEATVKPMVRYRYGLNGAGHESLQGSRARILVDIPNTRAAGLGKALPAGSVSLYTQTGGRLSLTAETGMGHTAVDGLIRLNPGTAFDLLVREEALRQDRIRETIIDQHYAVTVKNNKREAVTVEIAVDVYAHMSVTRSTVPVKREGAVAYMDVSLRPGEERKVEMTVRSSY